VSDTSKKTKDKYTERYWSSELERSAKDHSRFYELAEESVKVYNGTFKLPEVERKISVWWALIQTLLPAYYSRTPKVEALLRKKSGDAIHIVGAKVIERATQYVLDDCLPFDEIGLNAVLQYLLVGRGVLWARFDAAVEAKTVTYGLIKQPDGVLVDAQGNPFEGDQSKVVEAEGGIVSYSEEYQAIESEQAYLDSVHYNDFRKSVGRNEQEVEWKARCAYLSREEATRKFGKDTANGLKYDTLPEDVVKGNARDLNAYEGKTKLWEIWCKESGKVYWYHQGEKSVLESSEPPLDFKDFFPCEEICANQDPSSVVPVADYAHSKDLVIEVERLTSRIHAGVQAIRTNGAYDATLGKELEGLMTGDLKLIPIKGWPSYKSRGGLANAVEFLNIEPYVRGLDVLIQARNQALEKLYEQTAASDLIRGATSPIETATAQQLKSNFTSLRFSVRQKQMHQFFGKAIGKLGEIIAEHYRSETLAMICNAEDLMKDLPPGASWEDVDALLKDDPGRRYRIQVASDSMVELDERADRQERVDLLQSTGSFLGQLEPMVKQYPAIAPMAIDLLKFATRSYRAGKEIEGTLTATFQAIAQSVQQQQSQQQPQPGAMEAQARVQIAQLEAQTKQQELQVTIQEAAQKMDVERFKLQLEAERVRLEHSQFELESNLRSQELNLKAQEITSDSETKAAQAMLKARSDEFKALVDQQKMELEKYRTQLETYEKLIEERRLASSQGTNITISKDGAYTKKRKGRIIRDDAGNANIEIDEELIPVNGLVS
jgi:hypothetical protein